MTDLMRSNIEALSDAESDSPHGRWRTVGCGGTGFEHWKTYCCPVPNFNNSPNQGDCNYTPITGC